MSKKIMYEKVGSLLRVLGHPIRIRILLEIGRGEVCVCHLKAQLGIRQAYLSQHLMALREKGVLQTNREGRFIYYRVANQKTLDLISAAAQIQNIPLETINTKKKACDCPKCCGDQ